MRLFHDASEGNLARQPSNKSLSISKNNQSTLTDANLAAPPTISQSPTEGRAATTKGIRRRRRKHRKMSTTVPSPISTHKPPTMEYLNNTKIKEKGRNKIVRLNKRKNNSVRKHKKESQKHKNPWIIMESKNLVLPIMPTETTTIQSTTTLMSLKITRCSSNNGGCSHICNPKGPKKCECFRGFTLAKDRKKCIDIDECQPNKGGCQMNCTNTVGSFYCHCPAGFRLSRDRKRCEDINECLLRNGHGPCQDVCNNNYGGYRCSCSRLKGTILGDDLHSCLDVDECTQENGGCSHICINTFGRSFCSCPEGLELTADSKTCEDIDECQSEQAKIHCPNGCTNTLGSYKCTTTVQNFQNDGPSQELSCIPLELPKNGFFRCSKKHRLTEIGKSGIKNSNLGTKCFLMCPKGFKRIGKKYRVRCERNGGWIGDFDAKCLKVVKGL
ncbi:multiple epidermal growth factor-like domains protein 6 isoform X2 [Euwallacea fornicatus]|uniref:multiple epidermal growth factor-like domains protein 6 isoform X2 n=1 Tax=Euwallacea fornicatus TaxID=995702 RepID=UPI0033902C38